MTRRGRWVLETVTREPSAVTQFYWASSIRVVENDTGDTWRNVRHELERMHVVTMETAEGRVAQRTTTTSG